MVAELQPRSSTLIESSHPRQDTALTQSDGRGRFFTDPIQSSIDLSWGPSLPGVAPIWAGLVIPADDISSASMSHIAYAKTFAKLVYPLDFVSAVYADESHGLTLYTVYRGDRRAIVKRIYANYKRIIRMFPNEVADFQMLSEEQIESGLLPPTASTIFSK